jgi:prephenate dehydrogenase
MTSPSNSPAGAQRRAAIVGTGLIGGSIGMALRRQGWWVSGSDRDPSRARRALELGAIDEVGVGTAAAVTFIAVPAGAVAEVAKAVLSQQDAEERSGVVTDVAGI